MSNRRQVPTRAKGREALARYIRRVERRMRRLERYTEILARISAVMRASRLEAPEDQTVITIEIPVGHNR